MVTFRYISNDGGFALSETVENGTTVEQFLGSKGIVDFNNFTIRMTSGNGPRVCCANDVIVNGARLTVTPIKIEGE